MMGKLGFDIVVSKLPANDLQFCQQAIRTYDAVKNIIWQGDQYRLADPQTGNIASVLYMKNDKTSGVLFNYLVNNRYDEGSKLPILLKGLDPGKKYTLEEVNLYPGTKSTLDAGKIYSGDFLMTVGFNPDVRSSRSSVVLHVKEYGSAR